MKIKERFTAAVEAIRPPTLPELQQRLLAARQAFLAAQEARGAAQAALDIAYAGAEDQAVLKAESDRGQAVLVLERADGRVAAIEKQVSAAEAAAAAAASDEGRRKLTQLVAERERAGQLVLSAISALEEGVKAFDAVETEIVALPTTVRGGNAVIGYNLGSSQFRAHLSIELAQRSVFGQPSSMDVPRLDRWLSGGNNLLRAKE